MPVTFDYDPLDDGSLEELIRSHPQMHPTARRYLQTFLDSQHAGERMVRRSLCLPRAANALTSCPVAGPEAIDLRHVDGT